ncbi:MAG: hypothetical protein JWM42_974 [Burkholderia sp.]|nr:hypothetical protein [Burkholderia sp.]
MNRLITLLSATFIAVTIQGCAFNPQQANLTPTITVASSNEGKNVAVGVRVVDERPSKSLGRRGTAYGAAAEITANQDLADVVEKQVVEGLRRKGFKPVAFSATNEPRLSVEVRLLEYSTSQGFWTGGVHVKGALKAAATRSTGNYERLYRSEKEERIMVVPTAESNEKLINTALSELLNQVLEDANLFKFLAGGGAVESTASSAR